MGYLRNYYVTTVTMSNCEHLCHNNVMDYHESLLLTEQSLCQANTALLNSPWLSCTVHSEQKVCLTSHKYVISNNNNKKIKL